MLSQDEEHTPGNFKHYFNRDRTEEETKCLCRTHCKYKISALLNKKWTFIVALRSRFASSTLKFLELLKPPEVKRLQLQNKSPVLIF